MFKTLLNISKKGIVRPATLSKPSSSRGMSTWRPKGPPPTSHTAPVTISNLTNVKHHSQDTRYNDPGLFKKELELRSKRIVNSLTGQGLSAPHVEHAPKATHQVKEVPHPQHGTTHKSMSGASQPHPPQPRISKLGLKPRVDGPPGNTPHNTTGNTNHPHPPRPTPSELGFRRSVQAPEDPDRSGWLPWKAFQEHPHTYHPRPSHSVHITPGSSNHPPQVATFEHGV